MMADTVRTLELPPNVERRDLERTCRALARALGSPSSPARTALVAALARRLVDGAWSLSVHELGRIPLAHERAERVLDAWQAAADDPRVAEHSGAYAATFAHGLAEAWAEHADHHRRKAEERAA